MSDVRFNNHSTPGLGGPDADKFLSTFDEFVKRVETLRNSLTPRELLVLQLGLAASHLEESVVQGHVTRARAHAENVAKLLEEIKKSV